MKNYELTEIGKVITSNSETELILKKEFIPALIGLKGFSHVMVIWWFHKLDSKEMRAVRTIDKPYKTAPDTLGIFATRSPVRPNPIAVSIVNVLDIDEVNGAILVGYIDADTNSPILDIKPYTPSADKVENPDVPKWCAHWPKNMEESPTFDWLGEMNR